MITNYFLLNDDPEHTVYFVYDEYAEFGFFRNYPKDPDKAYPKLPINRIVSGKDFELIKLLIDYATEPAPFHDIRRIFYSNGEVYNHIRRIKEKLADYDDNGEQLIEDTNIKDKLIHNVPGHGYWIDFEWRCDENGLRLESDYQISKKLINSTDRFSFSYDPDTHPMVHRDIEKNHLMDLAKSSSKKTVVSIVGPFGIGKSRLAFELLRELEKEDWRTIWISSNNADTAVILDILNRIDGNVLIVIDDEPSCKGIFDSIIRYLLTVEIPYVNRLRIVITSDDERKEWEQYFTSDYIQYNSFQLNPISPLERVSPIIENYIKNYSYDFQHDEICKKTVTSVLNKLEEFSIRDPAPLYSLILSDAICKGENIDSWDIKKLYDHITSSTFDHDIHLRQSIHTIKESLLKQHSDAPLSNPSSANDVYNHEQSNIQSTDTEQKYRLHIDDYGDPGPETSYQDVDHDSRYQSSQKSQGKTRERPLLFDNLLKVVFHSSALQGVHDMIAFLQDYDAEKLDRLGYSKIDYIAWTDEFFKILSCHSPETVKLNADALEHILIRADGFLHDLGADYDRLAYTHRSEYGFRDDSDLVNIIQKFDFYYYVLYKCQNRIVDYSIKLASIYEATKRNMQYVLSHECPDKLMDLEFNGMEEFMSVEFIYWQTINWVLNWQIIFDTYIQPMAWIRERDVNSMLIPLYEKYVLFLSGLMEDNNRELCMKIIIENEKKLQSLYESEINRLLDEDFALYEEESYFKSDVPDDYEDMILGYIDEYEKHNMESERRVWGYEHYKLLEELSVIFSDSNDSPTIKSGYYDVDSIFGGFRNSELALIGGRQGAGKTSFALNIAQNALVEGNHILYFNLAQSKEIKVGDLIASEETDTTRHAYLKFFANIQEYTLPPDKECIECGSLKILDANMSASRIKEICLRLHSERPVNLVIIDDFHLLHLMLVDKNGRLMDYDRDAFDESIIQMKRLAIELNCPILVLTDLSRRVDSRKDHTPHISDINQSLGMTVIADSVILLKRDYYYNDYFYRRPSDEKIMDVIIAKNSERNTGTVTLPV